MVLPSHFLFKILNILKTSLLKFHKQMNSREVLNGMTYIACHCDDRYIVKTTDILSRKIEGLPKEEAV